MRIGVPSETKTLEGRVALVPAACADLVHRGHEVYVQAGAGLVADSDPVAEHQESQNKAAAPLRAVAVANAMKRVP